MRDGVVIDNEWIFYFFHKLVSQACTENDTHFRLSDAVFLNEANGFVDLIEHSVKI